MSRKVLIIVFLGIALLFCVGFRFSKSEKLLQSVIENVELEDSSVAVIDVPTSTCVETKLEAGEGFFQVMKRLEIDQSLIVKIIACLENEVELVHLKVGERFCAVYDTTQTQLQEFQYRPDRITNHRLLIDSVSDSVSYIYEEDPTEIRHRLITGYIEAGSTLNQALLDLDLSQSLTQVVNGILLCKVSFRTDARAGDLFEVLLREVFAEDSLVPGRENVLYVSYAGTRAGQHEAYRYFDGDASSSYNAHYTESGEALLFSSLRYPLDRIHITSSYGMRRHPVTGRRAMHSGVDYRARIGTPVYAVAPGTVVVSGYDKLSGKKIAIRHADNSTSYYLHLDRRLVSVGQAIRSQHVIARSGNTGRSTGPHLHFSIKKPNGKWMNPLQKRMIATPKLSGERHEEFQKQMEEIKQQYAVIKMADAPVYAQQESDSTVQQYEGES